MKKFVLLLSIVLLVFSASAQASYIGTGLMGTPMTMLPLSGLNPCLMMAPSPSLMLVPIYIQRPMLMPCMMPMVSVIPSQHVVLPISPFVQPGSNVQVIGIQSSATPSTQDMIFSIITNTN